MRLCLLLFFSTVVYAVTRIVEPDFEGVNFAKALFGQRLQKVFQETAVDSETSCQIQCLKHIRCLSYNLGTINEKGKFTCQLCDSDRFTSHENLTEEKKWHYRGMKVIWEFERNFNRFVTLLAHQAKKIPFASCRSWKKDEKIEFVEFNSMTFESLHVTHNALFFYCAWKQSSCKSNNFLCGKKGICIPDYHGKSFKCKCNLGYTSFLHNKNLTQKRHAMFERLSGADPDRFPQFYEKQSDVLKIG